MKRCDSIAANVAPMLAAAGKRHETHTRIDSFQNPKKKKRFMSLSGIYKLKSLTRVPNQV